MVIKNHLQELENYVDKFFFDDNNDQLTWKKRSDLQQVNNNLSGKKKFDNVLNQQLKRSLLASKKNDDGRFRSNVEERYMQAFVNTEGLPPELVHNTLNISKSLTNFYDMVSLYGIRKWNFWNIISYFKNNLNLLEYLHIINPNLSKNTQFQIELLKKGEKIKKNTLETKLNF